MSIGDMTHLDAGPEPRTEHQKTAALRRALIGKLVMEVALPLAGYYALRSAGVSVWLALTAGALLSVPWIVYGAIRDRRFDLTAAFTLSLMLAGALMSLVTGDPRVLMIRDASIGGLLGVWILVSVFTQRPFIMATSRAMVVAKVGVAGAEAWESRWNHEADFRRHIRILTAVWGVVFLGDALVRVALAYTLPLDSVPAVSTAQWLAVLGCLLVFHTWYVGKTGLKA